MDGGTWEGFWRRWVRMDIRGLERDLKLVE